MAIPKIDIQKDKKQKLLNIQTEKVQHAIMPSTTDSRSSDFQAPQGPRS